MDYYDGNTVTGLWNLAQNFAMSDNSFGTELRPVDGRRDQPGQRPDARHRRADVAAASRTTRSSATRSPKLDDCANPGGVDAVGQERRRPAEHRTASRWGWFQGGFKPTSVDADGKATCDSSHRNVADATIRDYVQHHEPFQYYASTANLHHLPPTLDGHDRLDRPGQPPVRPDRLRRRAGRRQPAVGLLPEGRPRSRTATRPTPTRSTSSTSSPARSTRSSSRPSGRAPRSSSPTTTPTAGTTT